MFVTNKRDAPHVSFCLLVKNTNKGRGIYNRVKEGGHFVYPSIVKERYEDGLKLLAENFNLADTLEVIDASGISLDQILIAQKGKVIKMNKKKIDNFLLKLNSGKKEGIDKIE